MYTDEDIERLKLLRRCVNNGRRISDVAALPTDALLALAAEDDQERPAVTYPVPPVGSNVEGILAECVAAMESLDRERLERALNEAKISLSSPALRQQVISPLLETIGNRWQEGSLRIMHEHMASTIVRSFLASLRNGHHHPSAPKIVLSTPPGQAHEMGAMMAAATADELGWSVCYLGPNLPAEEIAAAVRMTGAQVVALSVMYRDNDSHVLQELSRIRRFVDPSVPVLVGGRSVPALQTRIEATGCVVTPSIEEFQEQLTSFVR